MGNFIDLTGHKFGKWTVLGLDGVRNRHLFWKCKCDCGTEKAVESSGLTRGRSSSCGCWKFEHDLTGKRFGRLTVISLNTEIKRHNFRWNCICDCGNHVVVILMG